jgi:hypothetical protein
MLKKYPETLPVQLKDPKLTPSSLTIIAILNYSKSVQPIKRGKDKVLLNLN